MARSQSRSQKQKRVKSFLDEILGETQKESYLKTDPIAFVHQYVSSQDREVVGLIAALLSYGQVQQIQKVVKSILECLGPHPAQALHDPQKPWKQEALQRLYYRFYTSDDLQDFLEALSRTLVKYGSLQNAFRSSYTGDLLQALSQFREILLREHRRRSSGIRFLYPDPLKGAAKRWHMYLRWMVRRDVIDVGIWNFIPPSQLLIPLDTHTFDMSRKLGLTKLRTPHLKATLEITEELRKLDPQDPVKYDFALCRLGVLKLKHRDLSTLNSKELRRACAKFMPAS